MRDWESIGSMSGATTNGTVAGTADRARKPEALAANPSPQRDGLVDPMALLSILKRRFLLLVVTGGVLLGLLLGAFLLIPFAYKASALVFVDPRQPAITPTQEVLPGLGTDVANLESVVQVVQSEGFVLKLLEDLDTSDDPELSRFTDPREKLRAFKGKLNVERRGATYLVDIAYRSEDAERAARYANAVAQRFVEEQNGAGVEAAEVAATSLAERLGELRDNVRASESAVAAFKRDQNIVDLDPATTLAQRELSNISEQLALARSRTAEARARYENQVAVNLGTGEADDSSSMSNELALLLRARKDLGRELATLRDTYGSRHPRVTRIQPQIATLDAQISEERARVAESLQKRYQAALEEERDIERNLSDLSATSRESGTARVELADLERQAAADRAIYEKYLERFKATDEQTMLPIDNVRIVSLAIPPLNTTRPSLALVGAVLAVLSGLLALAFVMGFDLWAGARRKARRETGGPIGQGANRVPDSGKARRSKKAPADVAEAIRSTLHARGENEAAGQPVANANGSVDKSEERGALDRSAASVQPDDGANAPAARRAPREESQTLTALQRLARPSSRRSVVAAADTGAGDAGSQTTASAKASEEAPDRREKAPTHRHSEVDAVRQALEAKLRDHRENAPSSLSSNAHKTPAADGAVDETERHQIAQLKEEIARVRGELDRLRAGRRTMA